MRSKKLITAITIVGVLVLSLWLPIWRIRVLADGGGSFPAGDSRVDPQLGDRLAVYVNASNIAVWGIDNSKHGMPLTTFTVDDLMSATTTVVKDLGGLGQVTLRSLGNGKYVIAWIGGPFSATGQGPFAKTITRVPVSDNLAGGAPYNPGDNRITARTNDRMALYLKPDKIDVWGINAQNKGVFLVRFSLAEMKAAWASTLVRELPENNGTITLTGNGNGYYMISWQGGKFGATGTGEYAMCFNYAAYPLPTS